MKVIGVRSKLCIVSFDRTLIHSFDRTLTVKAVYCRSVHFTLHTYTETLYTETLHTETLHTETLYTERRTSV
jgi:hypothetical protein